MRYLRENFNLITKLFVNQIGMTIFGMILTMAVVQAAADNQTLWMLVSLFSVLFYLCLIYNVMWEAGAKNIIRIKAGRMPNDRAFAFKAALCAAFPNLVLGFVLIVVTVVRYASGNVGAEGESGFFVGATQVLGIILFLFQAMYSGLFSVLSLAFGEFWEPLMSALLYLFSSLPMILVAMGAYGLGTRNMYLLGKREPKGKGSKKE